MHQKKVTVRRNFSFLVNEKPGAGRFFGSCSSQLYGNVLPQMVVFIRLSQTSLVLVSKVRIFYAGSLEIHLKSDGLLISKQL